MIGIDYSSIDLNNINKYKLSSIITEDNLLFAITRLRDNRILQIKEITGLKQNFFLDIDYFYNLLKENNLHRKNFADVSIAYLAKEFSIVPKSVLNSESKEYENLLNSIKQYLDGYSIHKSYIDGVDAFCFFPFPKAVKKVLDDNYPNHSIQHANIPLIYQAPKSINAKDFILVNFHEYSLQTIVFKDNKFVQSSIYDIKTKDDILYYILLNLKNNAIPLNLAQVYLSGRVYKESSIYKMLFEHIKNIDFLNNLNRTDFSNIFLGKPKHLFFDIYSLSKCV